MTGRRLDRAFELLARVVEHDTAEQPAFLDEACAGDERLRDEVETLLAERRTLGDFLEKPAVVASPLAPGDRVASFEVVRRIGGGGSGTVYEALQGQPHRRLALKVMHADLGSDAARTRFLEEAEILARLDHPGIAHVYEAGVHEGLPWFALELVEAGRRITEFADEERLDVRARLALCARVCDAVHHGHQKGVLHCDLKPGNVLVAPGGAPKIIDFGIARLAMDRAATSTRTGTLPYMSPEQCTPGSRPDVRSDVYALGVLLYELLTERLPHDVATLPAAAAMERIRTGVPVPVDERVPALRGDVAAIVQKSIARAPEERYASVAALADDLRRLLDHRPVEARDGGLLYVARKFARREWLAFASLVALVVVALVAAFVSARFAVAAKRESRAAQREYERAESQSYVANMAAAAAALRANDVGEARLRLEQAPPSHRDWEWRHLRTRLDESARTLRAPASAEHGALSPDGTIAAGGFKVVAAWRVATGDVLFTHTAAGSCTAMSFSADSAALVLGDSRGVVTVLDAETGRERSRFDAHTAKVWAIVALPGGRFATAGHDATVKVWSLGAAEPVHTLRLDALPYSLAFAGGQLWVGDEAGSVRAWDVAADRAGPPWRAHAFNVEGVAASPDGRRLATVSMDRSVRLWDVATRTRLWTRSAHASGVKAVAFAPDGESVATVSVDRTVRLWSADGRPLARLVGHTDLVRSVAFAPDGRHVFSFSRDRTVKAWPARATEDLPTLRGHAHGVRALAFDEDGERLVSISERGTIKVWDVRTRSERATLWTGRHPVQAPRRLQVRGNEVTARRGHEGVGIWSLSDARFVRFVRRSRCKAFDAGTHGVFAAKDEVVHLLDRADGRLRKSWTLDGAAAELAVAPDGAVLACATDGAVALLPLRAGRRDRLPVQGGVNALDFHPRGHHLAVAHGTRVTIFDVATRRPVVELLGHAGGVADVAYSPSGARIATASYDGTVRLWEPRRGLQVLVLHGHLEYATSVAWSADGKRLASGGGNSGPDACVIHLWETE